MAALPQTSMSERVSTLTDPRADRGNEHLPVDILTITLCAVICGADDRVAVADVWGGEGGVAADLYGVVARDPVA
jgi:hypothetical protein